jgi:hypothetical protein
MRLPAMFTPSIHPLGSEKTDKMKRRFLAASCVARAVVRDACAARCRGKTAEGEISTEALESILAHPGEPIFRDRGVAGVGSRAFSISPQLNLRSPKTPESTPTYSCTAVQHLTKALFLSKPVEPPLSLSLIVSSATRQQGTKLLRLGRTATHLEGSHTPIQERTPQRSRR